jgi:hypothetical protein
MAPHVVAVPKMAYAKRGPVCPGVGTGTTFRTALVEAPLTAAEIVKDAGAVTDGAPNENVKDWAPAGTLILDRSEGNDGADDKETTRPVVAGPLNVTVPVTIAPAVAVAVLSWTPAGVTRLTGGFIFSEMVFDTEAFVEVLESIAAQMISVVVTETVSATKFTVALALP